VLSQVRDGQERVIAYYRKTMNKAEWNYCITHRELLSIVKTLEHFHKYLYGQEFHLRTDHCALTWLMSFKNLEGQTVRWIQHLQEYNFISEHRQGWKHKNADALSRRPCREECVQCHKVEAWENIAKVRGIAAMAAASWDLATLRTDQLNDPDIGPILQETETGQRPEWKDIADRSPTYKSYWAQWKSLAVRNDILEHNWESANGRVTVAQIVLPWSKVKDVLTELQDEPSGGHLGINKTLNKVRQRFYWLQARSHIEKWCRQCDTCAASRRPRSRNRGQMHQYNLGTPFERIAIDVAGPFARSDQGNRYLLIAMDYFTKWPEVYPIPNQEASTVAENLVTNFFCRFGVPRELHSDQGHNFEAHVLQEVLQRLGVSKMRTTPLHTQSDGMVERYIKTIESTYERLHLLLLAYRASTQDTTGFTPASLVFGRELRLPCDLLFGVPPDKERLTTNYARHPPVCPPKPEARHRPHEN
jgi:hypothetical protein